MTSCLSLGWVENLLLWLIALIVIVAILKLVVPWLFSMLGVDGGIIVRIIEIVVWGIVATAVVIFIFSLLYCLLPMAHYR